MRILGEYPEKSFSQTSAYWAMHLLWINRSSPTLSDNPLGSPKLNSQSATRGQAGSSLKMCPNSVLSPLCFLQKLFSKPFKSWIVSQKLLKDFQSAAQNPKFRSNTLTRFWKLPRNFQVYSWANPNTKRLLAGALKEFSSNSMPGIRSAGQHLGSLVFKIYFSLQNPTKSKAKNFIKICDKKSILPKKIC